MERGSEEEITTAQVAECSMHYIVMVTTGSPPSKRDAHSCNIVSGILLANSIAGLTMSIVSWWNHTPTPTRIKDTHAFGHASKHTLKYKSMSTRVHTHTYTCTRIQTYTYIRTRIPHVQIYRHTHTQVNK